ncbi:hypothetical protein [Desulfogranum marinum]|uniref:hypothetical protein n=1 Tax=Desulfogranum marinum TaxID=453220 RepID=UPI0029C87EEA|nr:hypothetical protein [Desulfogranum marinum]
MCGMIDYYLQLFAQLPVGGDNDKWALPSNYRAPHAPLLLLIVLDMFAKGKITRNFIVPSPELEERFYNALLLFTGDIGKDDFGETFYGLKHTGLWDLVPKAEAKDDSLLEEYVTNCLRKYYWGAKLPEDLYPLLVMETSRNKVRQVLLETYFAENVQGGLRL